MAVWKRKDGAGRTRWVARYYDPTGRERQRTFATRSAAQDWHNTQRDQAGRGDWLGPEVLRLRLHAIWLEYERTSLPTRRTNNQKNYREAWKNVDPVLGKFPIGKLRQADVQEFVNNLKMGAPTVRIALTVITLVLDHAVDNGYVRRNVARGVRKPPAGRPRERMLSAEELVHLAEEIGPRGRAEVLAMGLAGLRWEELAALRVGSVDFDRNRIHVFEAATFPGGRLVLDSVKTAGSDRWIGIPMLLRTELLARVAGKSPEDLVFPAPQGGYRQVGNFRRDEDWKGACTRAGISGVTPHDLRRTFGSLARYAGADLKHVQMALGHSSITTTARIYAHLYDKELDEVSAALDQNLKELSDRKDTDARAVNTSI